MLTAAQSYPSLSSNSANQAQSGSGGQAITFQLLNNAQSIVSPSNGRGNSDTEHSDLADGCRQTGSTSTGGGQISEPDEEDELGELDEENEDDENEDDDYEFMLEECYDMRSASKRRYWDEEYVLKRHFSALIPAFDPRPGRTNVNQTVDLVIQAPSTDPFEPLPSSIESDISLSCNKDRQPKMLISIRLSSGASGDYEIDLINPTWTLFAAIQQLLHVSNESGRHDKLFRVWEPTYTLVYKEWPVEHFDIDPNLPIHLAPMRLITPDGVEQPVSVNEINGGSANTVEDTLRLLRLLYEMRKDLTMDELTSLNSTQIKNTEKTLPVSFEDFISKKISNKLFQQLQDPLVLASGAQPYWCDRFIQHFPLLFPFESRQNYFQANAFGTSRTIVWLQSQRDNRLHGPSPRRDEHEFRMGRLLHERVKVPRGERLLNWAVELMQKTAHKKSILEVEFKNEEGTGLGPTLEFYALVALELQKKLLKMWLCDDLLIDPTSEPEPLLSQFNGPEFYVHHSAGLFPAPLPSGHPTTIRVCQLFHFLGMFTARALQDQRLVDLPLSLSFLKLVCNFNAEPSSASTSSQQSSTLNQFEKLHKPKDGKSFKRSLIGALSPEEQLIRDRDELSKDAQTKEDQFATSKAGIYAGLLDEQDFAQLFPQQSSFFAQLRTLFEQKQRILFDPNLSLTEKQRQIHNLYIPISQSETPVRVEDLCLTFQYLPPSKVYGFDAIDLKPSGEFEDVTIDNFDEYYELMMDFCLNVGISEQINAFRSGFNRVFPISKLTAFQPEELRLMMCGEQNPNWTREEIIAYTEPKLGFAKDSPGFLKFVNVLYDLNGPERKAFLQFATGCSSLPPGGLSNLHPRLTIVKKIDASDGSYPSVNTCAHYLKLPDYSSEQVLRERLLHATIEKGFHLN